MAKKEKASPEFQVLPFDTSEKPPASYVPEGYDSQDEFLSEMRKEYQLDLDADYENRRQAVDDKQFAAGEQWDPIVLEQRKGLPNLVINTVPQFIAQLVGDWRQSRAGIKVVPSENGDADTASIRGDLIRAIENNSRAQRVYDDAFESVCQCGDGSFRINVEYAKESVFDQDIFIRGITDALSVVWDRMSVDPTGRDARHVFVDDTIPDREFKRRFGDEPISTLNDLSANTRAELRSGGWIADSESRVTEYWRMIERDRILGMFQDGSIHTIEADTYDEIIEQHGMPIKTRVAPCTYAQMHIVTGYAILAGPYEYKLTRLPIIRMSGRTVNIAGRNVRYGVTRFMKDAVRLRNFWRSVAAEQLGYAPKAQWIATESAVEGREDVIRKAHLSRDPLIVVNDEANFGPGGNMQRLDPPAPQMALLNEAQVNAQDMKDITGLHDASLGIKSNETSGKAIMARQREGDVAALTYYDNGNESILEGGDVINQLISQIYDATRTVRIVGEDQATKLVKINDPMDPASPDLSIGQYDVAMTTGASYTTRRVEAAEAMMNAIQVAPELMQIAPDLIVKAQDWPGAEELAERLVKVVPPQYLSDKEKAEAGIQEQQPGLPPEIMEQLAKMQEELQKVSQENQMLKLENKNKNDENEIKRYDSVTQRIRALSDNMVDANQVELQALGNILEHEKHLSSQEHDAAQRDADRQLAQATAKAKPAPSKE